MFQSPLAQLPSIAQFSNARRTPLSAARRESSPQTFLNRGRLASIGWPRTRPVKPAIVRAPKWCALSISASQPASVCRSRSPSSSGLPNMPSVSMVTSASPIASRSCLRQQRQVLVHRLPEEGLDALEAESDDLRAHRPPDRAHWRGSWFRCGCRADALMDVPFK